jgi:branched-chain amino acid aminotransferase
VTFKITHRSESKLPSIDFNNLVFGDVFSDHQFQQKYKSGEWFEGEIMPYGPIQIDPSFSVLHYGQAQKHYDRFVKSCQRMNIPIISPDVFVESIKQLVDIDRNFVPLDKFKSLYLRPFVFAADEFLGVRAAQNYRYMIITGPVGNYYAEGIKPVRLTTSPEYVRAVIMAQR